MNHISEILEKQFKDLDINCSDENADKLILRIRLIYDPTTSVAKLQKHEVHSQDILKQLETSILNQISLKGIPEIKKVFVKQGKRQFFEQSSGAFITDKAKEWIIETDGSKIASIFNCDEVDFTRTTTNDLNEIYETLGIEAVRKALVNELRSVLRPYDVYVNYRHIAILCDVMTQRGALTAITRHGINRSELGPLRKCSFEETVDILLEAGLFSETDHLTGITENIMVGQLAPFGTGCFDVMLDMDKVRKAKEPERLLANINSENEEAFNNMNNNVGNSISSVSNSGFGLLGMQSPGRTPMLMSPTGDYCTRVGVNSSYGVFATSGGATNDPSRTSYNNFTPYPEAGKSPAYLGNNNRAHFVNSITTPNPYMSPHNNNIMTPNIMSTYEPYSPIDFESGANAAGAGMNSFFGENSIEKSLIRSPVPINSVNYTPSHYSVRSPMLQSASYKNSPNINSLNSSYHRVSSGYNKTYSPGKNFFY